MKFVLQQEDLLGLFQIGHLQLLVLHLHLKGKYINTMQGFPQFTIRLLVKSICTVDRTTLNHFKSVFGVFSWY